jgi:hypothetical protein
MKKPKETGAELEWKRRVAAVDPDFAQRMGMGAPTKKSAPRKKYGPTIGGPGVATAPRRKKGY